MKHTARFANNATTGSALIPVMLFVVVSFLLLGSVMMWSKNNSALVTRSYEFTRAQYAAEAGANKVFAAMQKYLNTTRISPTQTVLDGISTNQIPTGADHSLFSEYRFVTTDGTTGKIQATVLGAAVPRTMTVGPYAGLNAMVTPYQILSRVVGIARPVAVKAGIQRAVELQSIPIFQFAMFWDGDMDISCGRPMTITGRVHANGNGYFVPGSSQTFLSDVTLAGRMYNYGMPGDTTHPAPGAPTFSGTLTENAPRLNLPVGTSSPREILDSPPSSGPDPLATQRLYNKASLRIIVTDSGVTATDMSGTAVTLAAGMLVTTNSLYDWREKKTVSITELDIAKMIAAGQSPASGTIFIQDARTAPGTAVRLVNGASLPSSGLSVATPNPLYVKGNYNSVTRAPASIFCDAINVLSGNWQDARSAQAVGNRTATDTTIYAAFFAGNVPTNASNDYSGGVENFPRFAENWSPATLTYFGSMVCMFPSRYATGPFKQASYNPPVRVWAYDTQFNNPSQLPPGTPSVQTLRQTAWVAVN